MRPHDTEPVTRRCRHPCRPGERAALAGRARLASLARRAFHVRKVAIYFGLLLAWRVAARSARGATARWRRVSALPLLALGVARPRVLLAAGLAVARTTRLHDHQPARGDAHRHRPADDAEHPVRHDRRRRPEGHADGTGDIPLALTGTDRIAYLLLWPHAGPGGWRSPSRCCARAGRGAASPQILARSARRGRSAPAAPRSRPSSRARRRRRAGRRARGGWPEETRMMPTGQPIRLPARRADRPRRPWSVFALARPPAGSADRHRRSRPRPPSASPAATLRFEDRPTAASPSTTPTGQLVDVRAARHQRLHPRHAARAGARAKASATSAPSRPSG